MSQPDTTDTERELLAKAAANTGATVTSADNTRAILAALLNVLTS